MSEILSVSELNRLARSTWDLARVSCANLIDYCEPNSWVCSEVYIGQICVEPRVRLTEPEDLLSSTVPQYVNLTVSEVEPYRNGSDMTLYLSQVVGLDTHASEWSFWRRQQIIGSGQSIDLDDHIPIKSRLSDNMRLGSKNRQRWQDISDQLDKLTSNDAQRMINATQLALQQLHGE